MRTHRESCWLCALAPHVPSPRQCPLCGGRGYIVVENGDPPAGGFDEAYIAPLYDPLDDKRIDR